MTNDHRKWKLAFPRLLLVPLLLLPFQVDAQRTASTRSSARPHKQAPSIAGTWDLTWQTRRGPRQEGFIVVSQNGSQIEAEIHGRGAVNARGSVAGNSFSLQGSRMAVPYRITGHFNGDRMTGTLSILSVVRTFEGRKRAFH